MSAYLAPVEFADAMPTVEELPFLVVDGDFSGPRPDDVSDEMDKLDGRGDYALADDETDPHFAGMTRKEVRKAKAWIAWANGMAFARAIHAEVEAKINVRRVLLG